MDGDRITKRISYGFTLGAILSLGISSVSGFYYELQKKPYEKYHEIKTHRDAVQTLEELKKKRHSILPKFYYQPKTIKEDLTVVFANEQQKADSLDSIIQKVEEDVKSLEATEVYQKYSSWGKGAGYLKLTLSGCVLSILGAIVTELYRIQKGY